MEDAELNYNEFYLPCGNCNREVAVPTRDIYTRCCNQTGETSFRFECPNCFKIEFRILPKKNADLILVLQDEGVDQHEDWDLPRDSISMEQRKEITHDCILDFHQALNSSMNCLYLLSDVAV